MPYSPDSLTIQIGRNERERSFVWLQDIAESGAHLDMTTAEAFDGNGGFDPKDTKRHEATITPVRLRGALVSCRVTVSDLAPGEYVYRVGCDACEDSECYRFTVREGVERKQCFFLISDLHFNAYQRKPDSADPQGLWKHAEYARLLDAATSFGEMPDFFLSIGDNVSVCNMPARFYPDPTEYSKRRAADYAFIEYREFLSAAAMKSIPFATVMGNHDSEFLTEPEDIGDITSALLCMPNDDGYAGHYDGASSGDFFFRSGNLLVVGINAMVNSYANCEGCQKEVHRDFIARAVAAHPNVRFRILLNHVPAYSYVAGAPVRDSDGKPTETARMAAFFHELCDGFGFDVVFTGHQHAFSRTYPILGGRIMGAAEATTERAEDGKCKTTLVDPAGIVHYNVAAAMAHSFVSSLPEDPAKTYESYAITDRYYRQEQGVRNMDKYDGTTFPHSPTFVHATLAEEGEQDVLTLTAVALREATVFDTLTIKKTRK